MILEGYSLKDHPFGLWRKFADGRRGDGLVKIILAKIFDIRAGGIRDSTGVVDAEFFSP